MLDTPLDINILKFRNKEHSFFYDLDTGIFAESPPILEDIFDLIPEMKTGEIISALGKKYAKEEIVDCLEELGDMHEKKILFCKRGEKNREKGQKKLANLWLNVVHDCNMNCIYCFGEGGSYGKGKKYMTKETAEKCIDYWIENLGNSPRNKVYFFGGEPFLNQEVISYSIDYITHLLKDSGKLFNFNISTNGTVFNENFVKKLAEHNVELLFSLDGKQEIHDVNRPFVSGKGSYRVIADNIPKFKKYYENLKASVVITKKNALFLKQSVEHLWDLGFNDINYFLAIVNNDELCLTGEDLETLFPQIKELTDISFKSILEKGRRFCTDVLGICRLIHQNNKKGGCSFQSDYSIVFNPDGDIFKCYQLIGETGLSMGNVVGAPGWEKINKTFTKPLEERECNECWAAALCGGGCAHESFVFHGDLDTPYRVGCNHIKFLINEAFRLYTNLYIESPRSLNRVFGGKESGA